MPFGLKNAGAIYQRAMTAIFHDTIHDYLEVYVDDIVVKLRKQPAHIQYLKKAFERCRKFKLKMNQLKCAFGVSAEKYLGFIVHKDGINIDKDKTKAILAMEHPKTPKGLKSFLGKISYLRRFIPALAELTHPLQLLLRKCTSFSWGLEQKNSFEKTKQVLASSQVMISPSPGTPLLLYLTTTNTLIGSLIAQELEGKERPVYYLSRQIKRAEAN